MCLTLLAKELPGATGRAMFLAKATSVLQEMDWFMVFPGKS
jgi:hypothetical protein